MAKKDRIDRVLVERGMVPSREKARALVMAGKVTVDGKRIDKPGTQINGDASLQLEERNSSCESGG